MLNDENIISKSRSIIDLRNVNFTIQEFRLMEVYLSKINPQDETTASVTFTKQEYCDLMEIQSRLLESKRLNKYMQHYLITVLLNGWKMEKVLKCILCLKSKV